MSARRFFSPNNLLLWLALLLATPANADTTVPQYDPNGNLKSRTTTRGTSSYIYDAMDRLKTESGPGVNQTFGYDGNGNRLSDGTATYTIAPNGNRIANVNGNTLVYDPAGHLLDDGQGKTFAYNAAGRLKEVRINTVLVASYKYNYRGLRSHKITPQGTTLYHYDSRGHLIQTTDPQGTPKQSLHWADDQPIAQVDHTAGGDKIVYLHADHLNTPRYASDAEQNIVWRWEGGAFGETLPEEDPDNDGIATTINLRYGNSYADPETGWWYMWHRYYDPQTGRFPTSDPIGLRGGLNTYTYVYNNPTRWIDPLGLDVTACLYPGVPPHVGLAVNSFETTGRRTDGTSDLIDIITGKDVPGEVSRDTRKPSDCTTTKTTQEQDERIQQYIDDNINNPGNYNLYNRSCVDFVRDAYEQILDIPLSDTNLPTEIYSDIFFKNNK